MSAIGRCPSCGAELPADAPQGFCPRCLYRLGFDDVAESPPEDQFDRGDGRAPAGTTPALPKLGSFGDYELLEEIGHGGMGIVYKARQRSLDRIVALKLLLFGPHALPESVKRFRAEAVATAALHHPNIVAIHEVGFCAGQHFIAMDYVEGQSLSVLIRGNPLPARRAAGYVQAIAEAVHYAHEHGILHRDLKPANVLIDTQDQPLITDFGLAKRLEGDSELTVSGQVLGSPSYMPPEQATGKRGTVSRRTDVYALGAILYHALTGRPPFVGESLQDTVQGVLNREPVSPRLLNHGVPRDLETVCLKCLETEPAKRYPTAQMLAEDLGRFLEGKSVLARPVGRLARVWRWCRRQPVRAALIAALVAVAASGTGGILWQWRQAELARRDAVEKLWQSCLAQAQANRWSGRAGRRFAGLEAIRQAAAIRPTLELRNEAIACLALPDARVQCRLPLDGPRRSVGLAFDGNFERYARAFPDASVSICRVRDNAELLRLVPGGRMELCGLQFSPGGEFLAECPNEGAEARCTVWDLALRRLMFTVPFPVRSIMFSPDGKLVALAERGGTIHLHELPAGTETGQLTVAPEVGPVVFDPKGERLAVSRDRSPSVVILDLKSQSVCASLTNAGGAGFVSWSPDGQVLACPSTEERVYLWNVATGERRALEGHIGAVKAAIFNHRGDLLVSLGWDGTTRFWDPKLGLPLVSLSGGWLQNGFHPSDRQLGFGVGNYGLGIWEVDAARECRRLGRGATVWSGAFSADGRVLATASGDGVRLWQVHLNRLLAHLPMNEAHSVLWHPNGTSLIGSGWSGIELWPTEFSKEATEVRTAPPQKLSTLRVGQTALASDGRFLISVGTEDAGLLALDLDHPNPPRLLRGHPLANWVSISPTGKWFASGNWHGTGVKVWSAETWAPIKELPVSGNAMCAFSPDGQWLLTGSGEEYCLWTAGTWEPRLKLPRDQAGDMPGSIALSADGRMAALLHGRNRGVKLISIPDGRELAELDTGDPLCFSPDGGLLATTAGDYRSLLVWDLRLIREQLRALKLDWD